MPLNGEKRIESQDYARMHRVQAAQLRHEEEQEERSGQTGADEVLQVLPQAHDAQGNQVSRVA